LFTKKTKVLLNRPCHSDTFELPKELYAMSPFVLNDRIRCLTLSSRISMIFSLLLLTPHPGMAASNVGEKLFLSLDTSGSIDNTEYSLQTNGWANAFNSASIRSTIMATPGGIAVSAGQWSDFAGANTSPYGIPWTLLDNQTTIDGFVTSLRNLSREFSGGTGVAAGVNAGVNALLDNSLYSSGKLVLDISSDGTENSGGNVAAAKANAIANSVTINALAIEGDFGVSGVTDWYNANVVTHPDGFVQTTTGFSDYQRAAETKLLREFTNNVPAPLPIFGTAVALIESRRLRKRIKLSLKNLC